MNLMSQTPPTIGTPDNDTLLLGSGQNFLLIPEVFDGDAGVDQEITFTVTSSDPGVLEINDVTYVAGQTMAVVHATEKGAEGTVTIDVDATDADGTASTSFEVAIGPYPNHGINFEIHDIVFWQEVVPLQAVPAFSMIAPTGEAPYDQIDMVGLNLSVSAGCGSQYCTGADLFTSHFEGYVIPKVSGEYYFYMKSANDATIGLSTDETFDHRQVILMRSDESPTVGESVGDNEWKSVQVTLEAGKTYAIYGTQWVVHSKIGGISWEGPGIDKQYIPGENLSFVYDVEKPTTPGNFTVVTTGINDLLVSWSDATDNRNLSGYNLYLNGRLVNDELIGGTTFQVTGLVPGTRNCLVVTSMDKAGNESAESGVICTTTYETDDVAPTAPTLVEAPVISDLYMNVSWSGAEDGETEVRGYNLYVDGVLYNDTELIFEEEILLTGLVPETSYGIEVEAVDAGLNVSPKSSPETFTTKAFDPSDTSISDKKARLKVIMDPIGRSNGLGVNPNYKNGEFLNDPEQVKLIRELEAAAVRWGALTANPLSFKDYIGTGKAMTIGRMMDFCNQVGAYTVFCCGVEDATDWRTKPETFTNFLEYLGGPADSEYGAIRAAEGFTEPLLDESRGLVFEFGNEVWGGTSHDAQIGSDLVAYGEWCREMATLMRSSAYYDEEKIFLVYSGRQPIPNDMNSRHIHESIITGDTGEVDWLALSGYLGGNLNYSPEIDPGESELDYYKNGIAAMGRSISGLRATMDLVLQASGDFKPSYYYESNMSSAAYFGRLGQAVVQTDYYASAAETGGAIPTVFHLTGGQWQMTIPAEEGFTKLPLFYTTQFYNRFCKGNALRTEIETEAVITGATGSDYYLYPVGCHVFTQGDAFSILLLSRDFENDFTVQVDLPDELALLAPENGMKYVISGDGYSTKEAVLDSMQVTMSDSLLVHVPRYSMVVLSFGADGPAVENVPMGFYDYISAESIEIYAYGTEIFDITGREKKILLTNVEPEDVLSDAVIWTVDSDSVEVVAEKKSYGFEVKGSGTCAGNGTITVRASAWDNPEVYDEIEINISGQGTNCNVGTGEAFAGSLRIYPNPAREVLFIDGIGDGAEQLTVTDITGRVCMSRVCAAPQADLDISGLDAGIYYLRIQGRQQVVIRPFVKE